MQGRAGGGRRRPQAAPRASSPPAFTKLFSSSSEPKVKREPDAKHAKDRDSLESVKEEPGTGPDGKKFYYVGPKQKIESGSYYWKAGDRHLEESKLTLTEIRYEGFADPWPALRRSIHAGEVTSAGKLVLNWS